MFAGAVLQMQPKTLYLSRKREAAAAAKAAEEGKSGAGAAAANAGDDSATPHAQGVSPEGPPPPPLPARSPTSLFDGLRVRVPNVDEVSFKTMLGDAEQVVSPH